MMLALRRLVRVNRRIQYLPQRTRNRELEKYHGSGGGCGGCSVRHAEIEQGKERNRDGSETRTKEY